MFEFKKSKKGKGRGRVIQTVVPPEVGEKLDKIAEDSGLGISGLLRLMIMQHLNTPKDESDL